MCWRYRASCSIWRSFGGCGVRGGNPCRFVRKYKERKRERFLSEEEFRRLGEMLNEMEAEGVVSVYPAAAIRLLMLTGCRRNEIVELRWEDVDLEAGELRIRDGKTGGAAGAAVACGGGSAGGTARRCGQPVGDSGEQGGAAPVGSTAGVGTCAEAGGTGRRSDPRSSSQLRIACFGVGGESVDDREAVGAHAGSDDGEVRAPGAGIGQGVGIPDRRTASVRISSRRMWPRIHSDSTMAVYKRSEDSTQSGTRHVPLIG